MQATPEKTTNSLVARLNQMRDKGEEISSFYMARLKQDADKLRTISVSDADMVMGIIASIEGKETEMRHRHKNSIMHSPSGDQYYSNYGVSLWYLLYFAEAAKYHYDAYIKGDKREVINLRSAIAAFLLAGQVQNAFDLLKKYSGLLSKEKQAYDLLLLTTLVNEASADRFDLDAFQIKMENVFDVMRKKGLCGIQWAVTHEEVGDDAWWRLSLYLHLDAGEVIELEEDINNQLHDIGCESLEDGLVEVFIETKDEAYHDLLKGMDDSISTENMIPLNDELFNKIQNVLR